MTEWILFAIASVIAIGSAVMMVMGRNPVHCALWLVLAFFDVAVFFLILGAQFLFAVQIIVYAGAIMVLFLFVVMLLNPEREREPLVPGRQLLAAVGLAAVLLLLVIIGAAATNTRGGALPAPPAAITIRDLGGALYTRWMFPLELASVLLVVAMIGAIVLAKRRV